MGNQMSCMPPKEKKAPKKVSKLPKSKSTRREKEKLKDERLQQQALAMALYQQQMPRSSSLRCQGQPSKQGLPRSASARGRHVNDPVLQPHQLINKQEASANAETKQFVLIHGGGFGAWCWYKIIALLDEAGFVAHAIDLAGSGIDSTDPNCISGLELYVKPLTDFLGKLSEMEKVILVAHDFGGVCISYAMERFPQKIAKAVFVSATMVINGQRALDVFAPEVVSPDDLLPKAQLFIYANGSSHSPTSIEINKGFLKDLLFNQSPAKDVALASVSLRPVPFAPVLEKISLTPEHYGSIPRYYIETTEDMALTSAVQENLLKLNPPDQLFKLKGSDHAPFFSRPSALCKYLLEISQLNSRGPLQ